MNLNEIYEIRIMEYIHATIQKNTLNNNILIIIYIL